MFCRLNADNLISTVAWDGLANKGGFSEPRPGIRGV
jgi:hypothetical protein